MSVAATAASVRSLAADGKQQIQSQKQQKQQLMLQQQQQSHQPGRTGQPTAQQMEQQLFRQQRQQRGTGRVLQVVQESEAQTRVRRRFKVSLDSPYKQLQFSAADGVLSPAEEAELVKCLERCCSTLERHSFNKKQFFVLGVNQVSEALERLPLLRLLSSTSGPAVPAAPLNATCSTNKAQAVEASAVSAPSVTAAISSSTRKQNRQHGRADSTVSEDAVKLPIDDVAAVGIVLNQCWSENHTNKQNCCFSISHRLRLVQHLLLTTALLELPCVTIRHQGHALQNVFGIPSILAFAVLRSPRPPTRAHIAAASLPDIENFSIEAQTPLTAVQTGRAITPASKSGSTGAGGVKIVEKVKAVFDAVQDVINLMHQLEIKVVLPFYYPKWHTSPEQQQQQQLLLPGAAAALRSQRSSSLCGTPSFFNHVGIKTIASNKRVAADSSNAQQQHKHIKATRSAERFCRLLPTVITAQKCSTSVNSGKMNGSCTIKTNDTASQGSRRKKRRSKRRAYRQILHTQARERRLISLLS